jgi:hypothetical protein
VGLKETIRSRPKKLQSWPVLPLADLKAQVGLKEKIRSRPKKLQSWPVLPPADLKAQVGLKEKIRGIVATRVPLLSEDVSDTRYSKREGFKKWIGCPTDSESNEDKASTPGDVVSDTSANPSEIEFASGTEEYKSEWDKSSEDENMENMRFLRSRSVGKTSYIDQPIYKPLVRKGREAQQRQGGKSQKLWSVQTANSPFDIDTGGMDTGEKIVNEFTKVKIIALLTLGKKRLGMSRQSI